MQPEDSSLRRSVARGVTWTTGSTAFLFVVGLAQTAVLTHILRPRDYGLMAVVLVVLGIGQAFGDMGVSSAIIARQTTSRQTLSSLYWLNIVAGLVVTMVIIAATPLVARFFHQPRLKDLLPWAALTFLIRPIGQQFQVLFEKELRFDRLAKIDVAAALAAMIVAITAASAGAGVFSLVWGALAQVTVSAALLAYAGWSVWRPERRLQRSDLRGYLGFGLYQMGERTVNYLSSNVDYLVVGRFVGVRALGTYSLAYQLAVKPQVQFNPIVTRVAFPAFAKRQDDDAALRRGYLEMIRLIAFVVIPALTALAVAAPEFVAVVMGPRWHATVVLLQILVVLGILRALTNPVGSVLLAKNRPDIGFKFNAGLLVIMAAVLIAAAQFGVKEVALAETGVVAAAFLAWHLILRRVIGFSSTEYVREIGRPVLYSIISGIVMVGIRGFLIDQGLVDAVVLVATLSAGALSYCGLVASYERPYLRRLSGLFLGRARGNVGEPGNAAAPGV